MLLVFDIGNTNITLGVFNGEKLRATWCMATDVHQMPDEYAALILTLLHYRDINSSDIDVILFVFADCFHYISHRDGPFVASLSPEIVGFIVIGDGCRHGRLFKPIRCLLI